MATVLLELTFAALFWSNNTAVQWLPTTRGASRGSVWLSWQAPLYCRYSALPPIKHRALLQQIFNAGGLKHEQHFLSDSV